MSDDEVLPSTPSIRPDAAAARAGQPRPRNGAPSPSRIDSDTINARTAILREALRQARKLQNRIGLDPALSACRCFPSLWTSVLAPRLPDDVVRGSSAGAPSPSTPRRLRFRGGVWSTSSRAGWTDPRSPIAVGALAVVDGGSTSRTASSDTGRTSPPCRNIESTAPAARETQGSDRAMGWPPSRVVARIRSSPPCAVRTRPYVRRAHVNGIFGVAFKRPWLDLAESPPGPEIRESALGVATTSSTRFSIPTAFAIAPSATAWSRD